MAKPKTKKPLRVVKRKDPDIYQLRVTLQDTAPAIWRRLLVPADVTFARLHDYLQAAMGWTNSHLHRFEVAGRCIGMADVDELDELDPPTEDERRIKLSSVMSGEGNVMLYVYDFGDSWNHDVVLEKILGVDSRFCYPLCIGGARACPPEDCGGVGGYERFLDAIHDPRHDDHDDLLRWIGGYFDPESFDVNRVNEEMRGA